MGCGWWVFGCTVRGAAAGGAWAKVGAASGGLITGRGGWSGLLRGGVNLARLCELRGPIVWLGSFSWLCARLSGSIFGGLWGWALVRGE